MQEEDGILPGKGSSATPVCFIKSQFLTSWDTEHHMLPACSTPLSNTNSCSPCTPWPPSASLSSALPRVRDPSPDCWALPPAPHWLWRAEGRWDGEVLTQLCSCPAPSAPKLRLALGTGSETATSQSHPHSTAPHHHFSGSSLYPPNNHIHPFLTKMTK